LRWHVQVANLGDNRPHFFFLAPHQLDDLEPRAGSRGPYGGSIAHHCALFATRRLSGVITQVTVRLSGIPAVISAVVCSFASIEAAKIDFLVAEHGERR